ncbi:MAG TPA: chemotaxis protein CheD [Treponema sp.]|nr:chemotaxis protein CheD [Treponema sp.]
MFSHRVLAYSQPITTIKPGEYLVSRDDIIISTVLGSCIAVAMFDPASGTGGLNHFMLPGAFHPKRPPKPGQQGYPIIESDPQDFLEDSARYGMYAMEVLINGLLHLGARRNDLAAKVFGGASVLGFGRDGRRTVAQSNIEFVFEYLETEKIPIITSDVGGYEARKILFFVKEGKVLLKRIKGTFTDQIAQEEHLYEERLKAKPVDGSVHFFTEGQT